MNDTIFLVDAYAHIYRGYHAVPALSDATGRPSNAIFAMGRFLLTLEKEFSPRYGAFVFDKGAPKRLEILPDYKAQRPPMPEPLRAQIAAIRDMVRAAGWNILEMEGAEADDVIASVAERFQDHPVRVVSNDKDLAQLVNARVKLLQTPPRSGGKFLELGVAEVKEKFGVGPEAIPDYLALVGDSSDNIKGVDGVGAKTAAQLLERFGSLDRLLANVEAIERESVRKNVEAAGDLARRNYRLVTLEKDLAADDWRTLENLRVNSPNMEQALAIVDAYALKSLAKEMLTAFERRANPGLFDV